MHNAFSSSLYSATHTEHTPNLWSLFLFWQKNNMSWNGHLRMWKKCEIYFLPFFLNYLWQWGKVFFKVFPHIFCQNRKKSLHTMRKNLPKPLDLVIFCICSLNFSLDHDHDFFVRNQLNISKVLSLQIRKTSLIEAILRIPTSL